MRLLVVGHSFGSTYDQVKYAAIKQLDPSISVRLVVPAYMKGRFGPVAYEVHPSLLPQDVVPLKARLTSLQQHMTYVHNPLRLARLLVEFQPDVIHIEEEPQALITLETIGMQRAFARSAAVTVFTWDNILRPRRFPMGAVKRGFRRYSLKRVATVFCGNQRAAELVRSEGRFIGPTEVLPQYGLDPAEHQPGTEQSLRLELGLAGFSVVAYMGRLVPEKGLMALLEALGTLDSQPWKLLLIGNGPLEDEIRRSWIPRFPSRISLFPAVPCQQVPKYLRCADIFVLASYSTPVWKEQFGLTLAQAMLLGIPAIGSSSGAIPEVLGPGGIIFEERNVGALAEALKHLLTSSERRRNLGTAGREFALSKYSMESVGKKYLAAFNRASRVLDATAATASEPMKGVEAEE